MAYPESLAAVFEHSLSESDFEDGEIAGEGSEEGEVVEDVKPSEMEVDTVGGQMVSTEEGEVAEPDPTRGTCSGRWKEQHVERATDAIASGAADLAKVEDPAPKTRKKKRNRSSRSGRFPKRVNVFQFVKETCEHLQEKKHSLVWAAVKKLGVESFRSLVEEVDVIEKCGGQVTNDGKRKRTPGGVLWNILRGRLQPHVYKEIMSQGNEVHKQKVKATQESLKRNRMDVDEPASNKRQKFNDEDTRSTVPETRKEPQKKPQKSLDVTYGSLRDTTVVWNVQIQRAWAEGIRKKEKGNDAPVFPVTPASNLDVSPQEAFVTAHLEKKSAPLRERIRVPVQYNDLVKEKASMPPASESSDPSTKQQVVLEDAVSASVKVFEEE